MNLPRAEARKTIRVIKGISEAFKAVPAYPYFAADYEDPLQATAEFEKAIGEAKLAEQREKDRMRAS